MIFIHASCKDELCDSAAVLRVGNRITGLDDVYLVLLKGTHLEVVKDTGSDFLNTRDHDNAVDSERFSGFELDVFGRIWDMQVVSFRTFNSFFDAHD